MVIEKGIIDGIFYKYAGKKEAIISILVDVRDRVGHLSEEDIGYIAEITHRNKDDLMRIAREDISLNVGKEGRFIIEVCDGTTCHFSGSNHIMEELKSILKISPGETTKDRKFTLRAVKCLGVCSLAPAIRINGRIFSGLTRNKIKEILDGY